jgi:hypothetical protein
MLNVIEKTIADLPTQKITDIITEKITDKLSRVELEFLKSIIGFLEKNETIDNYRAQLLTNKSAISIKKYFEKFVNVGILIGIGKNKGRKYKLNGKENDK